MYVLKLTSDERRAIDFVGDRYDHGDKLFGLLCENGVYWQEKLKIDAVKGKGVIRKEHNENLDWNGKEDIYFVMIESIAWDIAAIIRRAMFPEDGKEGEGLTLFSSEFVNKLIKWYVDII